MLQTVEAIIDTQGRVSLLENVKLTRKHRALVTILDDKKEAEKEESIVGSITLIDEDLEGASRQISETINQSIENTIKSLNE
jgi:hypothetical protein